MKKVLLICIIMMLALTGCGDKMTSGGVCTLSVLCDDVLDDDRLSVEKKDIIPKDGIILQPVKIEILDGESAFDLLQRTLRDKKIHFEFSKSPIYDSVYIEGIANLYQKDCGDMSGWLYKLNGEIPDIALSGVYPQDGDTIEIYYSCDFSEMM